jgi:hypothetical protein
LLKKFEQSNTDSSRKIQKEADMSIEITERVSFLNRIHLFYGLTDIQFEILGEELTEERYPAGTEIVKQGTVGDRLYLIWSGKVNVFQSGKEQPLVTLVTGDHFGEDSMLVNHHHMTATCITSEETIVLVLGYEQFHLLAKQINNLKTNFTVMVNSHRLERRVHFNWLQQNEVIHFLTRKHYILLVKGLIGPILLALAGIVGMVATWYYSLWFPAMATLWYVSLIALLGAAGWGVWNGLDWGNDYYIITDRRVVWVEKVIGIYESRQESPLSAVQRVNVDMDLTGRLLDYGDLVIQTIVGSTLTLRNLDHPHQAAALIDQHWKRSKENSRRMEAEEMNIALRTRLLEDQKKPDEIDGIVAKPKEQKSPYEDQRGFINLFRLRFEGQTTVTYRKHIFVLFEQTLIPGIVLIALLGIFIYEVFSPGLTFAALFNVTSGWLQLLWVFLFIAAILWWLYEYVDWSNDIFQVTPDQIMDIDKTPLGQVTSDIASLDNILSIAYQRTGILELLFNYGTVFITIGGGKEMHFENIYNPSAVQEDIERRRLEKITKKEQEAITSERERVADWFAAYYQNEQQIRGEDASKAIHKADGTQTKPD